MSKNSKGRLAVFENILEGRNSNEQQFITEDDMTVCSDDLTIEDDDEVVISKKRKKLIKFSAEELDLDCKWKSCSGKYRNFDKFENHLKEHVKQLKGNADFYCLYGDCSFSTTNLKHAIQHISFHAYHENLMNRGANQVIRDNLPECCQEYNFVFPLIVEGYRCEWLECNDTLDTINDFISHVKMHVNGNPHSSSDGIKCCWIGCSFNFNVQNRLNVHARTHSKEKCLACPTCGAHFGTRGKFADHRKRQLAIEKQSYQCSQCSKLFATEKMLRDHMREHINQYKCSMCDMTCSKPSMLAKHIRYRHINERPFKCNLCEHSSITKQNLELHLITHCAEKLLACDECDYRCRSLYGMDRHIHREHGNSYTQTYECHVCKRTFLRGNHLTHHLMKRHDFRWPAGHSRFRYKEDSDGIFRLQTLRYESLEVIKEILKSSTNPPDPNPKRLKYEVKKSANESDVRVKSFELLVAEGVNREESDESSEMDEVQVKANDSTVSKEVVITISDVDKSGNVVKSEVIESNVLSGGYAVIDEGESVLDEDL